MLTVELVLPAPRLGTDTVMAVFVADAMIGSGNCTISELQAAVAPAGTGTVNVIVPPSRPVMVRDTTDAAVAPEPVKLKPEI